MGLMACEGSAEPYGAESEISDTSCEFVQTIAHSDPQLLIKEFVERDARGEFMESSGWFDGAVTCPGHEPGPDAATIVQGHQLRLVDAGMDSTIVEVTWRRVGYTGNTGVAPGTDVDSLLAVRTRFGWRIVSPALDPHAPVSPPPPPRLP